MTPVLAQICRYPVKGLSPDCIDRIAAEAGHTLPFDRQFALIHASSAVDRTTPNWAPKTNFLMLMRDEKLAQLGIEFDAETVTLTITRKGRAVSRGRLDQQLGRNVLQTFLSGFLGSGPRGNPAIVEAPAGRSFSDVPGSFVSIVNLASLRDIERVLRQPLDPHRFRANLYIDGAPAWSEFDWVGGAVRVGDVVLDLVEPIERCAATNVDPKTGQRDLNIPLTLQNGFGHARCGVYATIREGGALAVGDAITVIDPGVSEPVRLAERL